ncbi:hypothetical protein H9P43_003797 [Blastocladiella emersonii ATCC 22665]|nr:hypothetical protein H9P43_003775 [Blastocladiella emersonii ATCC 22665]KAI9182886.1 hypothetical protein H9P43_003797 [Blastocladiella emersonii ATCC 22665]
MNETESMDENECSKENQTLPVALEVAATAATPRGATPAPDCIILGGGKLYSSALRVVTTLTAGHAAAVLSDLYSALKEPTLGLAKIFTLLLDYSTLRSIVVIASTLLRGNATSLAASLYSHLPVDFATPTTAGPVAVARLDYLTTIVALTIAFGLITTLALRHARPTSKLDSGIHDDLDACDARDSTVADSDAETLVDASPDNFKTALETDWNNNDDVTVSGSSTTTTTTMSDSTCASSPASVLAQSVLDLDSIKSVTVPESKMLVEPPAKTDIPACDTVPRPITPTTGPSADAGLAQSAGSATPIIQPGNPNITKPAAAAVLDAEVALATDLTIPASDLGSRPTTPTTGLDIDSASMTMPKTLSNGYESGYETDASCSDSDSSDEDQFGFETRGAASIDQLSCSALFRNGTDMTPTVSADSAAAKKPTAAAATAYASPSSSDSDLAAADYVAINSADVLDAMDRDEYVKVDVRDSIPTPRLTDAKLDGEYEALETAAIAEEKDRDEFVLVF